MISSGVSSKKMKTVSTFLLLCSLSSFIFLNEARNPVDYWKTAMKGEPMPLVIEDLLHRTSRSESDENHGLSSSTDRFRQDVDVRPNAILYDTHVNANIVKPLGDGMMKCADNKDAKMKKIGKDLRHV